MADLQILVSIPMRIKVDLPQSKEVRLIIEARIEQKKALIAVNAQAHQLVKREARRLKDLLLSGTRTNRRIIKLQIDP